MSSKFWENRLLEYFKQKNEAGVSSAGLECRGDHTQPER